MLRSELAAYIDHTLLKPDATPDQIRKTCEEAISYGFAAVCIAPMWVPLAHTILHRTPVHLATVAGFPHGNTLSGAKAHETRLAIDAGANEVDMVLPIGAVKAGDFALVQADIHAVVKAAHKAAIIKVILETADLTPDEIVRCCGAAQEAGADYVKTSTGFASAGATVENVRLMRDSVGQGMGVKAAGGIRDLATALAMIEAGASRLGCSASIAIVESLAEAPTP